jgi:DNA polymerase III epsilon subunit-like protein
MRKFIVFDTETANSIDDPLFYDIGWAVVDENGQIYESASYVNADVFLDKELMNSAYFAEKVPTYWEQIKSGKRVLTTMYKIRKFFNDCVKRWKPEAICAHNARFDYRSTNATQRYFTDSKYRFFLPYGVEIWDTLKMAREALKNCEEYDTFCYENNYLTKRGCKRFTAEILYRFFSGNNDFEESHTGLEDVLIEKEILKECLKKGVASGRLW